MALHGFLEEGSVVTIHEDPVSKTKVEGLAVLLEQEIDESEIAGPGAGYWRVRFADGTVASRWVYPYQL